MYVYKRYPLVIIVISVFYAATLQAQTCSGLKLLEEFAGKKIALRNNTLLFTTDILKMDIDGSRHSYGVHDQGVEHICNGLSPVSPFECQNVVQQGICFHHCQQQFKAWHQDGHDLAKLHLYMRSIGLGGGNGSVPQVKVQPPPNDDMFVSHTSVRYGPWQKGQPVDSIEKQDAQLEAFEVPFFVIPPRFRALPWDATPGDLGVAVHAQAPARYVLFVVGDIGGKLDEGSVKLHELLSAKPLKPQIKPNVFGKLMQRHGDTSLTHFNKDSRLDLKVAIFRHTSRFDRSKSGSRVILQGIDNQDALLKFIRDKGEQALLAFGGSQAVIDCTREL